MEAPGIARSIIDVPPAPRNRDAPATEQVGKQEEGALGRDDAAEQPEQPEQSEQSERAEQPIRIATGTLNPTKIAAVETAAASFFPAVVVDAVEVPSGVPAQPFGDEQTALGALHRAAQAQRLRDADYGIGMESGVVEGPGKHLYVASWAAAIDRYGRVSYGGSERFALPPEVAEQVQLGRELGPLLVQLLGPHSQPGLRGAVAIMSGGRRNRADLIAIAIIHALAGLVVEWR